MPLEMPQYITVQNGSYKFELTDDYSIDVGPLPDFAMDLYCEIDDERLTIRAGYAWDGCSPPAGNPVKSRAPCLIHDALCQMLHKGQLSKGLGPFTKAHANAVHKLFFVHLRMNRMFWLRARIWYAAVVLAGSNYF